jgi:hypothetical protein
LEVFAVATLDRIDPAYTPWTPTASGMATEAESYTGRHRVANARRASMLRMMFYTPRHRRR